MPSQKFTYLLPAFDDDIACFAGYPLQHPHRANRKTAALFACSAWPLFKRSSNVVPTERLPRDEIGTAATMKAIRGVPPSVCYESGLVLANDDYVVVHGRFSNIGLT
jgi:hypothetical protein